uniref:K Homology domain-containing protein n=1 Tax=Skeletonema marinoi TaxID=267567 RepID=A0A7S2KI43_9STRA
MEVSALPPAPSAKAASGATVAKAAAGNVAADDYAKLADMDMVHDNRKTTPREHDQYEDTKSGVKAESVEDNRKECGRRNDQKLDIARWEPPSLSLQRKRSSGSDANDRPVKVSRVRTDRDESIDFLTCTLNIPPWMDQGRDLFLHLIGAGGQKTKKIESITNCWINISYPKLPSMPKPPMSITIKSKIARIPPVNVHTAIHTIEESLVEFLKDKNAEKRLLYELAATAIGSYKYSNNRRGGDCGGLLLREYNGLKYWLWLRDLPCCNINHHHGTFLLRMKPQLSDCNLEVFAESGLPLDQAPPFVLISGTKYGDVKKTVAHVVNAMKEHQACCDCTPKW